MSDLIVIQPQVTQLTVTEDVNQVVVSSVGVQGPTGATGATGAKGDTGDQGPSGVVSVTAPITNSGTSTSANIGIDTANFALLNAANIFTGNPQQVTISTAANRGLIVRGAASQTANMQEWQDSAGNVTAAVFRDGISIQGSRTVQPRGLTITQSSADVAGAVFTARKSRGTNQSPSVVVQNDIIGAFAFTGYNGSSYPTDTTLFGSTATLVSGSNISQSLFFTTGTSGSGNYVPNILVYHDGRVGVGSGFGNVVTGMFQPLATLQINSLAAGTVVTIVKGAASQTANLQQWQTSAGAVMTAITSAGTINFASGNTAATATAGAVTAPALVTGFITMQIAGTTVKVPYYSN